MEKVLDDATQRSLREQKVITTDEVAMKVGDIFLRGEIPDNCSFCVPGQPSWRDSYNVYPTDYKTYKLKLSNELVKITGQQVIELKKDGFLEI